MGFLKFIIYVGFVIVDVYEKFIQINNFLGFEFYIEWNGDIIMLF